MGFHMYHLLHSLLNYIHLLTISFNFFDLKNYFDVVFMLMGCIPSKQKKIVLASCKGW